MGLGVCGTDGTWLLHSGLDHNMPARVCWPAPQVQPACSLTATNPKVSSVHSIPSPHLSLNESSTPILPAPHPQNRYEKSKVVASVATEQGAKTVQLVLDLGTGRDVPAPHVAAFLASKAGLDNPPLLLAFNVRLSQKDTYIASLFMRQSIIAVLDPQWHHYDFYAAALTAHTMALRASDEGVAATTQPGASALPADTFGNPDFALADGTYTHVTVKTYNTDDPFINLDLTDKLCCPLEVITVDGSSSNAAIVDDEIFAKLPSSAALGSSLSGATTHQMLDFLASDTTAAYADITVESRYGYSIVTSMSNVGRIPF